MAAWVERAIAIVMALVWIGVRLPEVEWAYRSDPGLHWARNWIVAGYFTLGAILVTLVWISGPRWRALRALAWILLVLFLFGFGP